jgi:hypothetical protein
VKQHTESEQARLLVEIDGNYVIGRKTFVDKQLVNKMTAGRFVAVIPNIRI